MNSLVDAGIVERLRSEGDRRRTYLRLRSQALPTLAVPLVRDVRRVVFVCTHNSVRSPLAAALWSRHSVVPAASAGTEPAAVVHPRAVAAARRHGLVLAGSTADVRDVLVGEEFVVAVCDSAHERLAGTSGDRLHWSIPDPAAAETEAAFERAFEEVFAVITDRVIRLAATLAFQSRAA